MVPKDLLQLYTSTPVYASDLPIKKVSTLYTVYIEKMLNECKAVFPTVSETISSNMNEQECKKRS